MQLRVRYYRTADVAADHASQLSHGGLLVRVDAELDQFAQVKLELCLGTAATVLDAQVIQVFPGNGVAVTFTPTAELKQWVAAAGAAGDAEDRDAEHEVATATLESINKLKVSDSSEKLQMALRGNRDERAAVLRETNPTLHLHVLRNPGLQLDEIAAIAKLRTVSPDLLKQIADRREWAQRPEIAIALVRNPKTPVPLAVRMLDHVSAADLRQLAKDQNTRTPIQQAARKKVLG